MTSSRRCSSRFSATCSRSAPGWPIRPERVAERVDKGGRDGRRRAAAGGVDRSLESGPAAAAPVHPRRRVAAGGRRSTWRGRSAAAPSAAIVGLGPDAVEADVLVYLNRLSDLLFVMARAANHRAELPSRSGERRSARSRARTRTASGWRASTTRTFRSPRGCCRRRCVRTSPRSTPSRARPTTSPTSPAGRTTSASACSTTGARRLGSDPAVQSRETAELAVRPQSADFRRARAHDPSTAGCRGSCSRICSARSART